jgi:predicted enzyme involved in methoxymalonyl-ACP biosynthesis
MATPVPASTAEIDLDETLWGVVVGEDGVENLKLGHDFPGNVHLPLGRQLVTLPKAALV